MQSKTLAVVVMLATVAVGLVGCDAVSRTEFNALQQKYDELHGSHEELTAQLARSKASEASLKSSVAVDRQRARDAEASAAQWRARAQKQPKEKIVRVPGPPKVLASFSLAGKGILVGRGKAALTGTGAKRVRQIAAKIKSMLAGARVRVEGHTDSDPIRQSKWKDNLELSAQRAMIVARALIKAGIPAKRIETIAMGPHHPLADNKTVAGKAKNRRVVVKVVKP